MIMHVMLPIKVPQKNPRYDTLDNRKDKNIVLFVKGFENRAVLDNQ